MSSQLALLGGPPAVPPRTVHPWPHITDDDRRAVLDVMSSDNISEERWAQVSSLADEWAHYLSITHCLPCSSGTAALHMALVAAGVRSGDEVIIPAVTYWATATAVLLQNAIPIFVDIEPDRYCMDPGLLEAAISERTAAIMPVHLHGMPANLDPILEIAHRHSIPVIEDAAQAHGAVYKGNKCGTLGVAAGFSLEMSKNLTTGSVGGLFVTNDEAIFRRADVMRLFGGISPDFGSFGLGWKYRGDVFGQAFARSQLRRLDHRNAQRRANCQYLTTALQSIPGVNPPISFAECHEVFYVYVLELDHSELGITCDAVRFRDLVQEALRAEGVDVGLWQSAPVPALDVLQTRLGYGRGCPWTCHNILSPRYEIQNFPQAKHFFESHLYLYNVAPPNGEELMAMYVEAIDTVLGHIEQLL